MFSIIAHLEANNLFFFTVLTFQYKWYRFYVIHEPLVIRSLIIKFYTEDI